MNSYILYDEYIKTTLRNAPDTIYNNVEARIRKLCPTEQITQNLMKTFLDKTLKDLWSQNMIDFTSCWKVLY